MNIAGEKNYVFNFLFVDKVDNATALGFKTIVGVCFVHARVGKELASRHHEFKGAVAVNKVVKKPL